MIKEQIVEKLKASHFLAYLKKGNQSYGNEKCLFLSVNIIQKLQTLSPSMPLICLDAKSDCSELILQYFMNFYTQGI